MTGHMPSSWRHRAWVQSWGTLCSEGLAWWAAPLLALIPGRLRAGRVCRVSEWLSRIWPCGLPPLVIWAPTCLLRGRWPECPGDFKGRLLPQTSSSSPAPSSSGDHARSTQPGTSGRHRGRQRLPGLPTWGGGWGGGRKELGAIPGWAREGQGQCQGVRGRIHHPFHALGLCSLQPKAVSLTHSCLSPCFLNARGKSSCCCPSPVPSGQVA